MSDDPVLANDALLADIEAADLGRGLALWWLGQSGFLAQSAVGRVLFDPCIEAAGTDVTRQGMLPGSLKSIDVVALSQINADGWNAIELRRVFDANPKAAVVVPEANRNNIADCLGCDPSWPWGLNDGESVSFGELTVLAVATGREGFDIDSTGQCNTFGYIVWFGDLKLYYGGAARLNHALVAQLLPLAIDVALLTDDGGHPPDRAASRNGEEMARLAHAIGAQLLVLCDDGERELNLESRALFEATCKRLGQPFKLLNYGERILRNSATSSSRADRGV